MSLRDCCLHKMVYCSQCGVFSEDGKQYCYNCGTKIYNPKQGSSPKLTTTKSPSSPTSVSYKPRAPTSVGKQAVSSLSYTAPPTLRSQTTATPTPSAPSASSPSSSFSKSPNKFHASSSTTQQSKFTVF